MSIALTILGTFMTNSGLQGVCSRARTNGDLGERPDGRIAPITIAERMEKLGMPAPADELDPEDGD